MKVAILISSEKGGGAEFVARTWATALSAKGHETELVTLDDLVIEGDRRAPFKHFARVRNLRRRIERSRPNVLIAMMTYQNLLAIASVRLTAGRRRPFLVISERSIETLLSADEGRAQRAQYWLARLMYRLAPGVIAISHPVAAELIGGYGVSPQRIAVVPNPAMAKSLEFRPKGTRGSVQQVTLVVPGRLDTPKNPEVAIAVARVLESRGVEATVAYFGRGAHEAACREAARTEGIRAVFHGWHENWFDRCPEDSVVLLSSSYEGFGNVLVEAASRGLPSVASSTALGVADAIVPGVTGDLAVSLDPNDLADAVMRARSLTLPDVSAWLHRFDVEASAESLVSSITRLAARERGTT